MTKTPSPGLQGSSDQGTNCMKTAEATRELLWLQREGAAPAWRGARGSEGFRLEKQVQESSLNALTQPWELGSSCLTEGSSVNSAPSHPRGVSQEAAGTTGSEIEGEQIKTLGMHQALSPVIRGSFDPFLLRWPQKPSPEGATLFYYSMGLEQRGLMWSFWHQSPPTSGGPHSGDVLIQHLQNPLPASLPLRRH